MPGTRTRSRARRSTGCGCRRWISRAERASFSPEERVGMPEITLDLIFHHQGQILNELQRVRADIGDLKADMEVQSAIIRRLDGTVQSLVGEVRALVGQQDRQRQRLDRLREAGGKEGGAQGAR